MESRGMNAGDNREVEEFIRSVVSATLLASKYGGVVVVFGTGDEIVINYAIEEQEFDEIVQIIKEHAKFGSREEMLKDYQEVLDKLSNEEVQE